MKQKKLIMNNFMKANIHCFPEKNRVEKLFSL